MKINKKDFNKKNKEGGFSLLETLVAILIITVVLSSFMSLVTLSLKSFNTAKQRYIAAKIAQEGMELAVSKRNNNLFCVQVGTGCTISNWQDNLIGSWEVDATKVEQLLPGEEFSQFDDSDYICLAEIPASHRGRFGYCNNPLEYVRGNYTREVVITSLGPEKILLKSIVKWTDRLLAKQLVFEEVLFGIPD